MDDRIWAAIMLLGAIFMFIDLVSDLVERRNRK